MCRPTTCNTCGKTTWAGCGQHVAQVEASVPRAQWCPGHDSAAVPAATGGADSNGGFLARLFAGR